MSSSKIKRIILTKNRITKQRKRKKIIIDTNPINRYSFP